MLDGRRIEEFFSRQFFLTEFWFLWSTLMGSLLQHSVIEFRRYMNRFLYLFPDLRIASSDALYHDCEHTALVTLCVQDILRGRRLERTISPFDWGHTILAALNHDIGYVRGICAGDTADHFVIDAAGNTVVPPRGASDAFLMPYHVERGKILLGIALRPFRTSTRSASPLLSS
jgi:hypothetical protein